jgi:four helix bundle protein
LGQNNVANQSFNRAFRERVHRFVLQLLELISTLPRNDVTRVIIGQIVRSGTSILANYVEAQSASSKKDFINFLRHALKSANETKLWLELLRDTNNGNLELVSTLLEEADEIARILASSIIKLKKKNF